MNKMNEDEILKDIDNYITFANKSENFSDINEYLHYKELARRMKGLLDLYQQEKEKNKNLIKQLQEQNTEIQDISKQLREKEQEDIKMRAKFVLSLDEYILKDKIRAKIEEIKRKREEEWETAGISMLGSAIDVLLELLEE